MFVRTERLFLRPGWPEDLDDVVRALEGEGLGPRDGAASPDDSSGSAGECLAREYLERPCDPRLPRFFMYLRAPGGPRLVGGVSFDRDEAGDEVEMNYWIAPRFRGRGYAAEAVGAALREARSLGYRRIYANHVAGGWASSQVLESVGFQDTGRVRSERSDEKKAAGTARIYVAELERRTSPRIEAAVTGVQL